MERYILGLLCTAVIAFMWCIIFTDAQCGSAAFCCREDVTIAIFQLLHSQVLLSCCPGTLAQIWLTDFTAGKQGCTMSLHSNTSVNLYRSGALKCSLRRFPVQKVVEIIECHLLCCS